MSGRSVQELTARLRAELREVDDGYRSQVSLNPFPGSPQFRLHRALRLERGFSGDEAETLAAVAQDYRWRPGLPASLRDRWRPLEPGFRNTPDPGCGSCRVAGRDRYSRTCRRHRVKRRCSRCGAQTGELDWGSLCRPCVRLIDPEDRYLYPPIRSYRVGDDVLDEWLHLHGQGLSRGAAAQRLGMSRGAFDRAILRAARRRGVPCPLSPGTERTIRGGHVPGAGRAGGLPAKIRAAARG